MKTSNRVWIELVHPKEHKDLETPEQQKAFAEEQCRLANNMLQRLSGSGIARTEHFFWFERHYHYGGDMGSQELSDHGQWFSLDYLGREIPKEPI